MNLRTSLYMFVLMVPALFAGGCASRGGTALVQHIVLIKLTDPAKAQAMIADADRELPRIKSVVTYRSGRPLDAGRPGAQADYDAGFVLGFRDADGYRAYLDDPIHARLVELWKPEWESIRMIDFAPATAAQAGNRR